MRIFSSKELAEQEKRYRTNFINSLSGFKSLQLLGSINQEGRTNLAVFNSIFHVGANPPYLGLVVRPDGPEHDTLKNILSSEYYTLNNVCEEFYQKAHQTSARYSSGESEFVACGLSEEYIVNFPAPFVKDSTIQIGLKVAEVLPVKTNGTTILIGEVVLIRLNEAYLLADGTVDLEAAGSITVAGLDSYHRTQKIARLAYAKPHVEAKKM
ncbi:MAG: flavin reductase family protein [Sphingobacteriaceae bacterium]